MDFNKLNGVVTTPITKINGNYADASGAISVAGDGTALTEEQLAVLEIDHSEFLKAEDIEGKQDKLTAGSNITLRNNIISVSMDMKKALLQVFKKMGESDPVNKTYADAARETLVDAPEFGKLGTGLFIHWGVYAVPAGTYTGTKQAGNTTGTTSNYNTEWCMRDLGIPKDVYKAYETQFTGTNFDADEVAQLAADAGMKYIVITAKHHEGFSLYPTNYGSWDIRTSGCRTTILDELKTACDKHGLKFGLYFSQYWDWMAEGGFGLNHGGKWNGSTADLWTDAQHTKYCENACKQLKEMIETYEPYILWYDCGATQADKYQNMFISSYEQDYPQVLINDRMKHDRSYTGDFGTGERTICLRNRKYSESCFTQNSTWGYSVNNDNKYYGNEVCFKQFIIYSLAYGQNCLMNVGPMADGTIPPKQIELLQVMQRFKDNYGSFYGYKRLRTVSMPRWGYMIELAGNKIGCYIVAKNNANYNYTVLDGVPTDNLTNVEILTGTNATYQITDQDVIAVNGLELDNDTKIGVVICSYDVEPQCTDANIVYDGDELLARTFPVKSNMTFNFTNFNYTLIPSKSTEVTTEFYWGGTEEPVSVTVNHTTTTDVTYTVTILDMDEEDSTVLSYTDETPTYTFTAGHRYKVTLVVSGTSTSATFTFNCIHFDVATPTNATGVTLNESNIDLTVGSSVQLVATVLPADASNKRCTWSSNSDNATVTNGLVRAVSEGTAVITVSTEDGGYTATCTVNIVSGNVSVTGINIIEDTVTLIQCQDATVNVAVLPASANNKNFTLSSSDTNVCTIVDGKIVACENGNGTATITATSEDGNFTDTCTVTVIPEVRDYIFEAESLDGSSTQGDEPNILLFSDENTNWTLFGYVQDSKNPNADKNATLYQCVVSASPWTGVRVDANNNSVLNTGTAPANMRFRFTAGVDKYINAYSGQLLDSSNNGSESPTDLPKHPICLSRDGNTYKWSADGKTWNEFTGLTQAQLDRLKGEILTIGFDYKRASGQMTTTKYRFLKTDHPVCVAINYSSEYPFPKLYKTYDETRQG